MIKVVRDSSKSIRLTAKGTPRKRNPKAGEQVVVRLQDDRLNGVDDWIKRGIRERGEVLTRAAVLRLALEQFLATKGKPK
jgi:hypothetical protein